ncbi:HAMP domain-containing histidine kinase [Virgibacillus necropolis]|uniref:HAMP domain-containing sensor histidine kinase n=1 Tax=Virgibacillus necropolis TaxID=163877 RepID=UPI0038501D6D
MSIRKRLFLSNAAMVLMPIIIFVLLIILLNIVLNGGTNGFDHNGWNSTEESDAELFTQLTKIASLQQEKLSNHEYLDTLTNKLEGENSGFIIRKKDKVLYTGKHLQDISSDSLPAFGNEGYDPVAWLGHDQYSIRQHDFFFNDGTKGSILLINQAPGFVKFARTYFPILFISLLLILVLTNLLLSYFMSKKILKPVNQLSVASAKISEGNLDFSVYSDGKDELAMLVKSFDDMRARLKESTELREKYENNRKELIANISHDLKTPITSILGYVEGIQDGVANTAEKHKRYLDTIHAKAGYMDRLINELSLYSKLEVKSLPFHFEKVNIKAFMEDYLEEARSDLDEKDVELVLNTTDSHSIVLLDRDKLIRVMNNIIYNSVKYMDKDQCCIEMSLKDAGSMIEVMISDNGPGVSSEEISDIFNRFYRSDPSRNTGGSGLGLAIAAQIIEAHGGTIWAASSPGEGLRIYFTLKKPADKGDEHV